MRLALWPDSEPHEVDDFLAGRAREPLAVLVAEEGGSLLGFAELSIRNIAEGCTTGRVGYLEGWYVEPSARRRGIGRALVAAAEDWARAEGCSEFASDTEIDNEASAAAHAALGFEEVERIRCFRKVL
ncbi:MAG: GNAT family N-acetyltransferase [Myxococcales bacterium]|nr:GNAT family N-acetyltransferase [Myxococcales bacterium]